MGIRGRKALSPSFVFLPLSSSIGGGKQKLRGEKARPLIPIGERGKKGAWG
jgi:hypothetical protein